jgi:acetyl esterase
MKKNIFIVLATLMISSAYAENVQGPTGKVYAYKEVDGVVREMEIYFPKGHDTSKETVPGIILFHGGGWGGGSRKAFSYQCNYFASRGLVAATVTYTLASKKYKGQGSKKRVCITDAKSAIRWFKQHADELGIDPNRIIAGGGSAGGHICLLATTNPDLGDPNDPKEFDTSVAAYVLFNPALAANDSKDPEVDLLQHLNADFPPAIVFFGSNDTKWMKGWNSAYEKMTSLGIKSMDLWIAEGQTHAFFNREPWADITLAAADEFLTNLSFLEGKPTLAAPKTGEKLVKRH